MIAYMVTSEISDPDLAQRYIAWLGSGHLQDVCAAGALDAEVTAVLDPTTGAMTVISRYHFAAREAYDAYDTGPAVALRAAFHEAFPEQIDVNRMVAEVVARFPETA